jgi:hypothetical protein
MSRLREEVICTVHDGSVCIQLDNVRVDIPSHIWSKSNVLVDAVSSLTDSSDTEDFTLAVPTAWLQAWLDCYGNKAEHLSCASVHNLMNCLLVCFRS